MMAALPSFTNYLAPSDLNVTLSVRSRSSINENSSIINENIIKRSATSAFANYLTPSDLNVTLSVRSHSSINDNSSIINENSIEVSGPPTPEKRSGIHNLRREGYSEEKCRYVLVKYCSGIPRNFNYAEGVQLVYEKLREHCGDENLDLSIGVLYEFIEVDTQFTFEQGAAFRRWQFDHSRRAGDLANNHAPRMGNIIVGNIIPTERLRQWRHENPERQKGVKLSDSDSTNPASRSSVATFSPHFGIAHRSAWQIENTVYVSSMVGGTTVYHCPSPREMHERAWDETHGRGGRFVRERRIGPGELDLMDIQEPDDTKDSKRNKTPEILLPAWAQKLQRILKIRLPRDRFKMLYILRAKTKHVLTRRQDCSVPVYEGMQEVMNLPDADTEEGKTYYRNIKTTELPLGIEIPNSIFGRKHDLMMCNETNEAQALARLNRMISVEELAIQKCVEANHEAATTGNSWTYRGPMTASLFKDSGVDYQWEVFEPSNEGPSHQSSGDLGISGDSYFSFEEDRSSELFGLNIPNAPARSQRARSHSRRALQGGKDIIRHDSIKVAIDDSVDAARPYATWRRSGTQAHLFSGNSNTPEPADASSACHFDRFAARLQGKLHSPKSRTPRPQGLGSPVERSELGTRKRTAESVKARKEILKKIITFDGTQDNIVVNEQDKSPLSAVVASGNNEKNNNNNIIFNKTKSLKHKKRFRLSKTILQSPIIHKLSVVLDYNLPTIVNILKMAPPQPSDFSPIQVNGVFMLGSPAPLNIRKLSEEWQAHKEESARRQKPRPAPLKSTREEPEAAQQYPPRTSSRSKEESMDLQQRQRPRANTEFTSAPSASSFGTHLSNESRAVLGNFTDLGGEPTDSLRTTSGSNRKRMNMQDTSFRYRHEGDNPYEFEDDSFDDTDDRRVTTVQDFLDQKFGVKTERLPLREVARHPVVVNQGVGPLSGGRINGHVKNSASESNSNYSGRRPIVNATTAMSTQKPDRAEYQQQEFAHGYGLQRCRSSPHIGPPSIPAPARAMDSYVAYSNYEDNDHDSDSNMHAASKYHARSHASVDSPGRGRHRRPRGLGIDSVEPNDGVGFEEQLAREQEVEIVQDPSPAPKRSRSPMKKLFGPGGFLGNTGAGNSPADPQYVKPKPGMMSKIRTKLENIAEIPRSLSPIKNAFKAEDDDKTEDKTIVRTKTPARPVSLTPPRQAKIYMELELLICATTNKFLMEQYKANRISHESIKKISDYWRNKGRPQVIEFQYDQSTQRDLIVLNQKTFKFHGPGANNLLEVNAMLHGWKENAREMAIRTFCMPDTIIRKQLHDAYKLLELLGAAASTHLAHQELHQTFNRYVEKSQEAIAKRDSKKQSNDVEKLVTLAERPAKPTQSSQHNDRYQHMSSDHPAMGSGDRSFNHNARSQTPDRRAHNISRRPYDDDKTPTVAPVYPPGSPRYTDDPYPHPRSRNGSITNQMLSKDRPYEAYSEHSDVPNGYHAPRPAFTGMNRPRISVESGNQRRYHESTKSGSSRAADSHIGRGYYDSNNSYYSNGSGSGSRRQLDHHDSATSWSSQIASQAGSARNQTYYDEIEGSSFYSGHGTNSRIQNDHDRQGRPTAYSSEAPQPQAQSSHRKDRGEVIQDPRNNVDQQVGSPDGLDDLSSFGKYGAGL